MLIVKTEAGQRVMKDRSVALTPRQRSAFILMDGKKTMEQVLESTAATGVTRADIDMLLELGLVATTDAKPKAAQALGGLAPGTGASRAASAPDAPARDTPDLTGNTPQQRYAAAYPIAIQLTSSLGLRGFRLNLAVEGASSYQELLQVAPRIREAVGPERYQRLQQVLGAP